MNILEACADPNLFAPWFRDRPTWKAWFAFLAGLFALPMDEEAQAIYRAHTGRTQLPSRPFQEAWLVVGRRGGKSFAMALIAVYLATFRSYREYLQPGERATIAIIAADRKQARVILRYVRGLLTNISMLAQMVCRETAEGFELTNGVIIEVSSASFRATRGYTFAAILCDEIAFWRVDSESVNVDSEIINALRPGLVTIPGAIMICASSPYARVGELWEAYRRYYGQDNAPLVWHATTRDMNPSVGQTVVDAELEKDYARARAEYLAEFRTDIESFVLREAVDAVVASGRRELPPQPTQVYTAFVDPSGGSGADSFTLAIAHRHDSASFLDVVREWRPPYNPESVVEEACALLAAYDIATVTADRWGGDWVAERFRMSGGVAYEASERTKSQIYLELLPLLNSGRIELLDNPRLISQLCGLERRTSRGSGKDTIDHAPGSHDDLINAAAGALVLAAEDANSLAVWERLI
jgi:hypothetical protein